MSDVDVRRVMASGCMIHVRWYGRCERVLWDGMLCWPRHTRVRHLRHVHVMRRSCSAVYVVLPCTLLCHALRRRIVTHGRSSYRHASRTLAKHVKLSPACLSVVHKRSSRTSSHTRRSCHSDDSTTISDVRHRQRYVTQRSASHRIMI